MVILDVVVPTLGRFFVHDDLTLEEVLLLPTTTDEELKTLAECMQRKDAPWAKKSDVLFASLASLWDIDRGDVTFLVNNEPAPETEDHGRT